MNLDLTISLRTFRVIGAERFTSDPFEDMRLSGSLQPPPPPGPALIRVSAEGLSVMAAVHLLRETADQLDDQRYVEMNGEIQRPAQHGDCFEGCNGHEVTS